MSAFIVEPKTINLIVTWLDYEFRKDPYLERIAKEYQADVVSAGWQQWLAEQMYLLNVQAVDQRYSEQNEVSAFVYSPFYPSVRVAAFKSLQCWLYQCTEGTVPETWLYKFMRELEEQLAIKIVMALPSYDEADWG